MHWNVGENESWIRKNAQANTLCFSKNSCFGVMENGKIERIYEDSKKWLRFKKAGKPTSIQPNFTGILELPQSPALSNRIELTTNYLKFPGQRCLQTDGLLQGCHLCWALFKVWPGLRALLLRGRELHWIRSDPGWVPELQHRELWVRHRSWGRLRICLSLGNLCSAECTILLFALWEQNP